jgi:REP element-mobilizing transposase RayT
MPDHLHWLFELQSAIPLSRLVMTTKSFTAREINETLGRAGQPVWQRGYFDHAVRREEDLRQIARYIVTNPLRAGIVANVSDYPLWDACWL